MTDLILPPHLRQARTSFRYVDSTGFARGEYTGAAKTASKGGDRLAATIEFTKHGGLSTDEKSNRAVLRSFIASLRGRQNRAYLYDHSYRRRGSMQTGELLANNAFANGTTGWTALTGTTLSAQDRVLRVMANVGGSQPEFKQSVSLTAYAPHVLRAFIVDGFQTAGLSIGPVIDSPNSSVTGYTATRGMATATCVPYTGTPSDQYPGLLLATSGYTAGAYYSVPFTSLSRCALADNPNNVLQRSDEFDHAYWGKAAASVTANLVAAPDGTVTADSLVENSATSTHEIALASGVTVSAAVADYAFALAIKGGTRAWARVHLRETTSSTVASAYINLSTGAVGTTATGANWANLRTFVVDLGNGWYYVCIVARKTNAATGLDADVQIATANGTNSYTGNGSGNIYLWRATLSQSSVPVRLVQSTSDAVSGATQTGSGMYSKGWPASTDGLLLVDDQFEVITSRGSELKILTAPVNSDAAGLAYMQFEPPLRGSPADSAAVIVHQPMARCMFTGDAAGWDNEPGFWSSAALQFEETCSAPP